MRTKRRSLSLLHIFLALSLSCTGTEPTSETASDTPEEEGATSADEEASTEEEGKAADPVDLDEDTDPEADRETRETGITRSETETSTSPERDFGFCAKGTGPKLSELPRCTSNAPLSYPPIPVEGLDPGDELIPLGHLRPPSHTFPTTHMYWHIKDSDIQKPGVDIISLKSMADMTISVIGFNKNLSSGVVHYHIDFHPCREVMGHIAYIASISPKLAAAFDESQASCSRDGTTVRRCCLKVNVQTTAGEEIGTLGGTNSRGIDFDMQDTRITKLSFANPERFRVDPDGFDRFHYVCPVDYFTGDLKKQLEGKIRRVGMVAPLCGRIDQDIVGTAQGTWFPPGTKNPTEDREGETIHLSYDNIDPSKAVFSIGNSSFGTARHVVSIPLTTGRVNREFKDVTADGNTYCYEGLDGISGQLILQLTSNTTLKMEKQPPTGFGCGTGPWSFTSSAHTFER